MNAYGYCPHCKAPVKTRERRPNGDDICENGHKYPSRHSLRHAGMMMLLVDKVEDAPGKIKLEGTVAD